MSTRPITLIQLISEQTMQNLIPMLRFKPASVVHITTSHTAPRSNDVIKAANLCGLSPQIDHVRLSAMPSITETSGAVTRAISAAHARQHIPLVNFTGGTKLMSIGAHSAALQSSPPAISFYVDTDNETFVDGSTAPGLDQLLQGNTSFTPISHHLTVSTIAAAHGQDKVSPGRDWRPFVPMATHLLEHPDDEQTTFEALHGENGLFPHGRNPTSPEKWLEVLERQFSLPPAVTKLAHELSLLRVTKQGTCQLPNTTQDDLIALAHARTHDQLVPNYHEKLFHTIEPCQFAIAFLTGAWWEVIVAQAADRTGLFRDLRWSVTVGPTDEPPLEEDILAVDGVRIVHISCKRGGNKARLLRHLEELYGRARTIGENFTRRFLAVWIPPKGRAFRTLRRRAQELGINLLTKDNISNPNAFARTRT